MLKHTLLAPPKSVLKRTLKSTIATVGVSVGAGNFEDAVPCVDPTASRRAAQSRIRFIGIVYGILRIGFAD